MYSSIINPSTGRKVSVFSRIGKNIIKKYLLNLQLGSGKSGCSEIKEKKACNKNNRCTWYIRNRSGILKKNAACLNHFKSSRKPKMYVNSFILFLINDMKFNFDNHTITKELLHDINNLFGEFCNHKKYINMSGNINEKLEQLKIDIIDKIINEQYAVLYKHRPPGLKKEVIKIKNKINKRLAPVRSWKLLRKKKASTTILENEPDYEDEKFKIFIIEHFLTGAQGSVFNAKVYDKTKQRYIEGNNDNLVLIKLAGFNNNGGNTPSLDEDIVENEIGKIMGENEIGPKQYGNIIINDQTTKNNLIRKLISKTFKNAHKFFQLTFSSDPEKHSIYYKPNMKILIMEKIEGIPLLKLVKSEGYKKWIEDNPKFGKKICNLIKKMHEIGYVHNDLHLNNILIAKDRPFLIDFGKSEQFNPSNITTHVSEKIEKDFHYLKTNANLNCDV